MANLIDSSYFDSGARGIPNLQRDEILEELNEVITRLEPIFLTKTFGYEFKEAMIASPNDVRFKFILDGDEFTDKEGYIQKYAGIKTSIADFVYYYFYKERANTAGGVGFVSGKVENASVVPAYSKPNYVFNRINDDLNVLLDYFYMNESLYENDNLVFSIYNKLNDFGF